MIPVLFHLGPLTVYSYGLMMALGFLAADYVIRLECIRRGTRPRIFVVDRDRGRGGRADRIARLRHPGRPSDLPCRSQVDDFFGLGIRVLRGNDRRTDRRVPGFAMVPNRDRRDDGHVRARARDRAGNRENRMPAVGRWRLGAAVHLAVGDVVSQGDCRLELRHGVEARRSLSPRFRLFSAVSECIRRRFTKQFCMSACL